ncbi:MAG: DapH/DapD/GlmU-related protein [Acidimicrobiales bacterium]
MTVRIHPTALIEEGVSIGEGTAVWDGVHVRGPGTSIGRRCVVGEKTYIAYGVDIDDLVKINAFVYIPTMVSIGRGAMISAHVTFTNDRYPRAATPELDDLRPSEPDDETLATRVGAGATIGAAAVIGPGIELGAFCMVGMGSVVTRSVAPFTLVAGNPATVLAAVCRCGPPLLRAVDGRLPDAADVACDHCGRRYRIADGLVHEHAAGGPAAADHRPAQVA